MSELEQNIKALTGLVDWARVYGGLKETVLCDPETMVSIEEVAHRTKEMLMELWPRVLTEGEVKILCSMAATTESSQVFLEDRSDDGTITIRPAIAFNLHTYDCFACFVTTMIEGWFYEGHLKDYGRKWRVWTHMPDATQRLKVKWNDSD